jgi:hypothetical protein
VVKNGVRDFKVVPRGPTLIVSSIVVRPGIVIRAQTRLSHRAPKLMNTQEKRQAAPSEKPHRIPGKPLVSTILWRSVFHLRGCATKRRRSDHRDRPAEADIAIFSVTRNRLHASKILIVQRRSTQPSKRPLVMGAKENESKLAVELTRVPSFRELLLSSQMITQNSAQIGTDADINLASVLQFRHSKQVSLPISPFLHSRRPLPGTN